MRLLLRDTEKTDALCFRDERFTLLFVSDNGTAGDADGGRLLLLLLFADLLCAFLAPDCCCASSEEWLLLLLFGFGDLEAETEEADDAVVAVLAERCAEGTETAPLPPEWLFRQDDEDTMPDSWIEEDAEMLFKL